LRAIFALLDPDPDSGSTDLISLQVNRYEGDCVLQERQKREDDLGEERIEYERLCRGEQSLSPLQQSKLKCRYSTGKNLYLLIGKEIFTVVHSSHSFPLAFLKQQFFFFL
jgi:hypothetical protein